MWTLEENCFQWKISKCSFKVSIIKLDKSFDSKATKTLGDEVSINNFSSGDDPMINKVQETF